MALTRVRAAGEESGSGKRINSFGPHRVEEFMITVTTRALGSRRKLLDDRDVPPPAGLPDDGGRMTLRDFIAHVVAKEVEAFRERQGRRRFVRVLTAKEIHDAAGQGAVRPGESDLDQEVDDEVAVAAALQAFEDGIYLVIVDGEEQRDLDREVHVAPDSRVTFLRLVMLAGG
jgi:hypothetical protein